MQRYFNGCTYQEIATQTGKEFNRDLDAKQVFVIIKNLRAAYGAKNMVHLCNYLVAEGKIKATKHENPPSES